MQKYVHPAQVRNTIGLAYDSYQRVKGLIVGRLDRDVRHPEWTGQLLQRFGQPDAQAYNVMVAGSKGKGSNAILVAAILQQAGLRTGLFTGPHHVDFMERFRIDGEVIDESVFCGLMEAVHSQALALPIPDNQYIGPVGLLATVAALWFRQQQTEVNIYECGRGAKHDDVNQIRHQGALLTPVFLEHPTQLGHTLDEIATEKLAVVTSDTGWLVCGRQQPNVLQRLGELELPEIFLPLSDPAYATKRKESWIEVRATNGGMSSVVRLPAQLDYLAENAFAALAAAIAVWRDVRPGTPFPELLDLQRVRLPGRMDILSSRPLTLLDGTIHRDSAARVAKFATSRLRGGQVQRFGIVASLPADKDGEGVLATLAECASWLILTESTNPNLHYDERLYQAVAKHYAQVAQIPNVGEALARAKAGVTADDGLLLLGTQSFVGDILRLFGERTCPIWRRTK